MAIYHLRSSFPERSVFFLGIKLGDDGSGYFWDLEPQGHPLRNGWKFCDFQPFPM